MGIGDFVDHLGDSVEHGVGNLVSGAEHVAGEAADQTAHLVGDGLNTVGLHSAGQAVDSAGDWAADHLGAQVAEQQLGQTDDPAKLVHGDVGRINETAGELQKFAAAFGETADGLHKIDTAHWSGAAAEAFRAKFHSHPQQWDDAQKACAQAATALQQYGRAVQAAQNEAKQAIAEYAKGQQASQQARDAYNSQVNSFNTQLQAFQSGGGAGTPPQRPGEFHDPGEQSIKDAQAMLDRARQQRDDAAAQMHSAVRAATDLAPATPSFTQRVADDAADLTQGAIAGEEHVLGGVLKGAGDIVKFARSLNPIDPYNLTHPAEYVAGVSGTAAGLLHAANHPVDLVKGLVGTGWGSDPFEAFGKLIPNVALAVGTDGAGTAADAGADVAERAAAEAGERDSVGVAEGAADHPSVGEANGEPEVNSNTNDGTQGTPDPVDLTTGRVFLDQTDVELAGVLPLALTRSHRSDLRVGRWFGPTWSSTVDQRLEIDATGVHFLGADGMLLTYPRPMDAPVLPVHGTPWPLTACDDGFTITNPGTGRTLHFTDTGESVLPITAITDRNGNRIAFSYTSAGVPLGIEHSGGYHIAIDTENGLVTALRLLDGTDTGAVLRRYRYNEKRRLTEVVNPDDQSTVFTYDAAGQLTRWDDTNGMWYQYIYDPEGRCVECHGKDGFLDCTLEFDGSVTRHTNSLGHTTTYYLNDDRQIVREADPLGGETHSEWDQHHRLLSRTDPLGRTTRYEYDEAGNLIAASRPDGSQTRYEYNDLRLPVTVIAPDGTISRREYDECGNLTALTDPLGAVTRYTYDEHGHLRQTTDALGHVRRVDTNTAGLPIAVTDAVGATTHYDRDPFGRVATISDPTGGAARFGWTIDGKPTWRTLPDGATEEWSYDGEGNPQAHTDPVGQSTHTEIGHFDLPTAEIRPDGSRLEFAYDTELRLTTVTNEQGLVWRYDYDPAGNLIRETDFNGRAVSYRHDAAGQLAERVNGVGETTYFARDVLGNVIERRNGNTTATFTYDELGRLVEAMDDDTQVQLHRDPLGRVLTETINGRTVTSVYDLLGRRIRRRTPSGADSVWDYDAEDRPTTLHTADRTLRFDYDPAGREIQRTLGDSAVLAQTWDANHQLQSQTLTSAGRRAQHRSYTYRPDGLLTGIDDQLTGARTFDLDAAGRVTAVHGPKWTERYAYDTAGNITSATWPGPADSPDADVVGDREYTGTLIRRAGNVRYEHDAQGRVVLRQQKRLSRKPATWRYYWDTDDHLTQVLTPDGALWRYRYDPLGRRVAKQRLTPDGRGVLEETLFTWDGNTLTEQAHRSPDNPAPGGLRVTVWDYEPGTYRPITQHHRAPLRHAPQQWIDEQFYAIITDLIGTPTELIDDHGTITWHHHTTLWGRTTAHNSANAHTPLRFPGQYADDESGLHYNHHRHYDPTTGRYTSTDPLGLRGGPSPHRYVHNPTRWIDPLGLVCSSGDDGTQSIYKAPQRGLGQSQYEHGYDSNDFSGGDQSAYFAKDKPLADEFAKHYGEGVIETRIPMDEYMEKYAQYETPYQGGPLTELPVPSSRVEGLNKYQRIWHK